MCKAGKQTTLCVKSEDGDGDGDGRGDGDGSAKRRAKREFRDKNTRERNTRATKRMKRGTFEYGSDESSMSSGTFACCFYPLSFQLFFSLSCGTVLCSIVHM